MGLASKEIATVLGGETATDGSPCSGTNVLLLHLKSHIQLLFVQPQLLRGGYLSNHVNQTSAHNHYHYQELRFFQIPPGGQRRLSVQAMASDLGDLSCFEEHPPLHPLVR